MTDASASALSKGLAVLEAVLSNDRLSDLARATGLSPSTTHRILAELVAKGWVVQDESKAYRPGRRMHMIGGLLHGDAEINRQARPALEGLRSATGMTVHFGLVKDDVVMYAAKLDGEGAYRMKSRVGAVVPLHSTSIGKAAMSIMSEQQIVALMRSAGMRTVTERTHTTISSLLDDLETCRARGYAIDDGENEPSLRCIGAPVRNAAGAPIGGVSVSALAFELPAARTREVARDVVRAASLVSAALGDEAAS